MGCRQRDRPGFLDQLGVDFGGLDYDFFLLFHRHLGVEASRPVSSGATVIGDSDRLAASVAALLR